jgi:hypothetical protein
MTSAIATIVTDLVSALRAAPAVSVNVHRSRSRAVNGTSVVVKPVGASIDAKTIAGARLMLSTTIGVECYQQATSTSPDLEIDPLVVATFDRIMQDTTLGGKVLDIVPQSVNYEFDSDGTNSVLATLIFSVEHETKNNSLEA